MSNKILLPSSENSKLENFIEDISNKFENKENKNIEPEYEFKAFFKGEKDREKIRNFHNELQNEIITKLNGKVIFDGVIKDTRYYNDDDNLLKDSKISMIRTRQQTDFNEYDEENRKKTIYIVKKRICDNKDNYKVQEYEKNVDNDYGKEKLEKEYGLKEIKSSKKLRKELKFKINFNGKEEDIKVAFDEYLDEENKMIVPFFEVEGKSDDIIERGWEELQKLDIMKDKKFLITQAGPKKLKEELEREKLIENLSKKGEKFLSKSLIKNIIDSVVILIENQTIYKTIDEIIIGEDLFKNNFLTDSLKENFKILLESQLDNQIKGKNFERYFHRIITNENPKNNPRKKFYDKFNREYSGYMKALLNSILKEYKNTIKNNENKEIDKKQLKYIINSKLDIFLKSVFMFDDSLIKDDLEKILYLGRYTIKSKYNEYSNNIKLIFNEEDLKNIPDIWKTYQGQDNTRILEQLATSYSRAWASVVSKGGEIGNKELITKKLEDIEKEQLSFLARKFSEWLNVNRELLNFDTIKNLALENFYHIFLLAKNDLAFSRFKNNKFDQNFINKVISDSKFNKVLFTKNNFQVKEKGPELFEYFIKNIFEDSEKTSEEIVEGFKEYNKKHNQDIIKDKDKDKSDNNFNIDDLENIPEKNINFDYWQELKIEQRLYLFINKVLEKKGNGKNLKDGIGIKKTFFKDNNKKDKYINIFSEIEFRKIIKKTDGEILSESEKKDFIKYKKLVKKDFTQLNNYLKNNNLKSKNIEEIGIYLAKNNPNLFQLLVSWFQFNLKLKKIDNKQNIIEEIQKYSLYSDTFSEILLNDINLGNLEKEGIEFITTTSSAYNTSVSTNKRIIELHDRIGNDKSIDALDNFYVEINGKNILLKDLTGLYLKDDYKTARSFVLNGIKTTRDLLNDDIENINNEYLAILERIGFPIKNKVALKKLLEFQKFVYKIILPVVDELHNKSFDTTNVLATDIYRSINNYINLTNQKVDSGKEFKSILRKVMIKNGGNIEKIGDASRATIFGDDFDNLKKQIIDFVNKNKTNKAGKKIKSIRFEDKIGNLFKKATRPNGYRDATFAIVYEDGSSVEIQFQLNAFYAIKTGDLKISSNNQEKVLNLKAEKGEKFKIENFDIGKKLKYEGIEFTEEEKQEIINYAELMDEKLSANFCELFDIKTDKEDEKLQFNTDYTYNLERTIGEINSSIYEKLRVLDRILFDIANGYLAGELIKKVL